ncbi:CotO family spore coat protein [Ornithinibacillus halotolerans]|uniref:Spore coat protein CotO n=1 Tax=Ornithinibacillus halotolerans TaxID=1274357 RepID=A0A916RYT9_9BACI|nr:CotO family spore coat protein [Ornithinibacillus halotolerans]GGA74153.1 hypothetical protein GCM10008025_17400 [Ornithinibacillus halotolerans]
MTNKRKFANEPLMYIHQPNQNKPTAPMQHQYLSPKKSNVTAPSNEVEKKTNQQPIKRRRPLSSFHNGAAEEAANKVKKRYPAEPQMESSSSTDNELDMEEKKKFKDMTKDEKIKYFLNTPDYLPRMRCEVLTEGKKYRGVIQSYEEQVVRMRVGRRSVYINDEEIMDILLLGF